MKNAIFTSIFLLLSLSSFAQSSLLKDSIRYIYDHQTLMIQNNGYVKNGDYYPAGFFQKNLVNELKRYPIALSAFKKHKKNTFYSVTLTTVGIASIATGITELAYGNKKKGNLYTWTGIGFTLISIPIANNAKNQFHRSIWLYNREAVLQH